MSHQVFTRIIDRRFPGAKLQSVQRLTGGVSADVHRLDTVLADGRRTSFVLRAHGSTHSGHDADLEYRLLQALRQGGLPVPEPVHVDTSGEWLADPFLLLSFVHGSTDIPPRKADERIDAMAAMLASIHAAPTKDLPTLPKRLDPLPELFDYLPVEAEWDALRAHLQSLGATRYGGDPELLHGDFWPENLLWRNGRIAAILDWEDAALGDPLSDVACTRLELRYKFGRSGMERFTEVYARHREVAPSRLWLWQVYVAAAAQHFMGRWGLEPEREARMRAEALASIREASEMLTR